MKIKVEQRHIDAGTRGAAGHCPVALAIKEAVGSPDVRVTTIVTVGDNGNYCLPPMVLSEIRLFDAGEGMTPMEFDLELIDDGGYQR